MAGVALVVCERAAAPRRRLGCSRPPCRTCPAPTASAAWASTSRWCSRRSGRAVREERAPTAEGARAASLSQLAPGAQKAPGGAAPRRAPIDANRYTLGMAPTYDVAISFLAEDEPLAVQLRAALPGLKVFVYLNHQEELAGTDGLETFRDAFRRQSRVVVVLFRARWGQTRWTGVEENAIKEFCLDGGWNRVVLVALEKAKPPKWYPETKIYLDYEAFGFEELVGVVKARCLDAGADVRPPSALDLAKKAAEAERFNDETECLLRNPQPLRDLTGTLFAAIETRLEAIEREAGLPSLRGSVDGEYSAAFMPDGPSIQLLRHWRFGHNNHAAVGLRLYRGRFMTPLERARGAIQIEKPTEVRRAELTLTRALGLGWCWKERATVLSSEAAAELVVKMLVEARKRYGG